MTREHLDKAPKSSQKVTSEKSDSVSKVLLMGFFPDGGL